MYSLVNPAELQTAAQLDHDAAYDGPSATGVYAMDFGNKPQGWNVSYRKFPGGQWVAHCTENVSHTMPGILRDEWWFMQNGQWVRED